MSKACVVAALVAAGLIAGCGDSDSSSSAGGSAGAARQPGAFPVKLASARGATTITSTPKRVVTVGLRDQDALLGLGVKAVGAMDWYGQGTFAKWPWEHWGGSPPKVVSTGGGFDIDYERVAAQRPDLILGVYQDLDGSAYKKLTRIAPTVAQSGRYPAYQTPWDVEAQTIGSAVGRRPEADAKIRAIKAKFAQVREQHPEFAKQTAAMFDPGTGKVFVFSYRDARGDFLRQLGFKPAPKVVAATKGKFGVQLSDEKVDAVDVDRLFVLGDKKTLPKIDANPVYKRLNVVRQHRVVVLPYYDRPNYGAAIAFNSVLSLPYAIDGTLKQIAASDRARIGG